MSFEERNQLKKEIVEKIIEANPEATPNYCIALLDEIKESVISAAMNSILTKWNLNIGQAGWKAFLNGRICEKWCRKS